MIKKMILSYILCFFCLTTESFAIEKPYIQPEEMDAKTGDQRIILKNNSSYIKYYNIIREKIKKNAYTEYMDPRDVGEVFVSFTVTREGKIINKVINETKTAASRHLHDIALKAVAQASPLPSFPKELLDYPQLSFNIMISFEIDGDLKDRAPSTNPSLTPKKCKIDGTEMKMVPIAYGIPTFSEIRAAGKGELIRGGLIKTSDASEYGYICPKCKKRLIK